MKLNGEIKLGGDKSISHRAVMIASLINDISSIKTTTKRDFRKVNVKLAELEESIKAEVKLKSFICSLLINKN